MTRSTLIFLVLLALVLAACGEQTVFVASDTGDVSDATDDTDQGDAGSDTVEDPGADSADASGDVDPGDAVSDTSEDATDIGMDVQRDPLTDTAPDTTDAGTDPALDPGSEVSMDIGDGSGMDAGTDTGMDAMTDAGMDTGPVACSVSGRPGECIDVGDCTGDRSPTPGFCPGPGNIQCCTETPMGGECNVDDMPTPNAGITALPGVGACPAGMIPVADFCIHQYEAFVEVVDGDGTFSPWSPFHPPEGVRVRAVSAPDAVPQGYITGRQAADACAESGARLCTDTEWLRACQGPDGYTYPYGDTRDDGVCNDARSPHPVVQYFGTSADWIWSQLGNACIGQQDDTVALTGEHDMCVTVEGAYDMMGNLHEWTADPAGTFRGGFYTDTVINGPGCLYRTTAHSVGHWDYSTGFRCCADI